MKKEVNPYDVKLAELHELLAKKHKKHKKHKMHQGITIIQRAIDAKLIEVEQARPTEINNNDPLRIQFSADRNSKVKKWNDGL